MEQATLNADRADAVGRPVSIDNAIERYYPFLRAIAKKLARGDIERAEVLLHDGIVDSLRRWRSYRPEDATVAAWVIWNMRGRRSRHDERDARERRLFNRNLTVSSASVSDEYGEGALVMPSVEPDQHYIIELKQTLEMLREIPRAELLLRNAMGETYVEIAEGRITRERVRQVIEGARKKLKNMEG